LLRTTNPQRSLWETILPAGILALPEELAQVDALLDEPEFLAPFATHYDPVAGRPSIPIDTYLRMMFLKFRYGLGYQRLCREVQDSISWQRFCRIPLGGQVPHATTLVKLTHRVGPAAVDQLNQALLAKAADHKVLRTGKLRADTTVVAANVAYPTDAGLLARAIAKLAGTIQRVQAAGGATRTQVRDRRRAARRRALKLAKSLRARTGQAKQQVAECTAELAELAERAAADAARVARNARRQLGRAGNAASGKLRRLVSDLETTIGRTEQIIGQTRTRLAGQIPHGATRLVSLHDFDARPIVKGRLGKPVEFGYKAQVLDNPDGIVLDHEILVGNPADAPLLVPAVQRVIQRAGRVPGAATADRSYGEATVDDALDELGVQRVAIPRKGTPGTARQAREHTRPFRRLVKWRTGSEGRISHLKHRYGWDRTRMDGIDGARIWCGHGVLAHNLVKVSGLVAAKQQRRAALSDHDAGRGPAS
jgi:IS5 family transposase